MSAAADLTHFPIVEDFRLVDIVSGIQFDQFRRLWRVPTRKISGLILMNSAVRVKDGSLINVEDLARLTERWSSSKGIVQRSGCHNEYLGTGTRR